MKSAAFLKNLFWDLSRAGADHKGGRKWESLEQKRKVCRLRIRDSMSEGSGEFFFQDHVRNWCNLIFTNIFGTPFLKQYFFSSLLDLTMAECRTKRLVYCHKCWFTTEENSIYFVDISTNKTYLWVIKQMLQIEKVHRCRSLIRLEENNDFAESELINMYEMKL